MNDTAAERNIEIKARIASDDDFKSRIGIAQELTGTTGELIHQQDVFFNTQQGRVKLRYLKPPARSILVYYNRPDQKGPKLSEFHKVEVDEPEVLEKILTLTNGKQGILRKERLLFIYEQTRIHLDDVENLGKFIEFEVCLNPKQTVEEGQNVAEKLMKLFLVNQDDLISGAYFDQQNNS